MPMIYFFESMRITLGVQHYYKGITKIASHFLFCIMSQTLYSFVICFGVPLTWALEDFHLRTNSILGF